jgi:hypothetical protein
LTIHGVAGRVVAAVVSSTIDRKVEMHRVKSLLFAVLALLVLGSFAASAAFATPKSTSVLLLEGASFPIRFSSLPAEPNTIKSELQNAAGTLTGEGFLLQGELTSATSGLYEVLFLNVTEPTNREKCNTTGDGRGEVLVPKGNLTLVHDESEEKGAGELFEVKEFTITCGTLRITIKGNVVGLAEEIPVGRDILSLFLAHLHCVTGRFGEPEDQQYWISLLSSRLTPLLLANFGGGFRKACEEIVGKIHIDISQMAEFMNP